MARKPKPTPEEPATASPGVDPPATASTTDTGEIASLPPLRLEWRSPAELAENPANWRRHPQSQLAALTDVIAEVGWAGACLFNEATGRLIDGHARRKVALEQGAEKIPVLMGRWTEEQERKILATLDPLAAKAEADPEKLAALIAQIDTESEAVKQLLAELTPPVEAEGEDDGGGADVPEHYQILIDCASEEQQSQLLEQLTAEGIACRSLIS